MINLSFAHYGGPRNHLTCLFPDGWREEVAGGPFQTPPCRQSDRARSRSAAMSNNIMIAYISNICHVNPSSSGFFLREVMKLETLLVLNVAFFLRDSPFRRNLTDVLSLILTDFLPSLCHPFDSFTWPFFCGSREESWKCSTSSTRRISIVCGSQSGRVAKLCWWGLRSDGRHHLYKRNINALSKTTKRLDVTMQCYRHLKIWYGNLSRSILILISSILWQNNNKIEALSLK